MRSSFESLSLSQTSKNTSFPIGFNLENVLWSKMEDNIFPHRKSESAREFLEDWVPVAFSNLCLLLVLVKDHLVDTCDLSGLVWKCTLTCHHGITCKRQEDLKTGSFLWISRTHLHIGVAFVPRPIHVRKILQQNCKSPDNEAIDQAWQKKSIEIKNYPNKKPTAIQNLTK